MLPQGIRYRIMLRDSQHKKTPYSRNLYRESDRQAVDAAVRELRRIRHAHPGEHCYDRWALDQVDDRGRMIRLVATGDIATYRLCAS